MIWYNLILKTSEIKGLFILLVFYFYFGRFFMNDVWIAPSILSADFAKLGEEIDLITDAGANLIHFDVMDNHYVPNLTIGPVVCESIKKYGTTLPIDVHLMIKPVDRIIPAFANAGASYITFHPEASDHVDRTLQLIRDCGCKSGLVLNLTTPLSILEYVMDKIDMVLLMSINPGFSGQKLIPAIYDKIRQLRSIIDKSGKSIRLQIDGGVNLSNIKALHSAGVDTFVTGSALFGSECYKAFISAARNSLNSLD